MSVARILATRPKCWWGRRFACPDFYYALLVVLAMLCPLFGQGADPLQEAAAALQRGDFPAAERKLRAALNSQPDDPETLSLLGFALDSQKKFAEADALHWKALAVAPGSATVLGRFAHHLLTTGDDKGAREAFRKAVSIDPSDSYSNLELARLLVKLKDSAPAKEALGYLDRLPASQRDAPQAAGLRLAAVELSGDRAAADTLAARLATTTASAASLSASLGWALAETGLYARAETFLSQALALEPSDFRVMYDLGVLAVYARHYERARQVLETAVRQQPDNVDALYSLAFAYSALKQPEPALRHAAHAARLAPRRADVQRLIAVAAGELQAYEDSAAAWDRYATLAPNDDTARRERGFARIHLRQFETGVPDLEWYIARHPMDPIGHYQLGLAQSTSDPTKGLASLDRALELKPDFVAARAARGALHYLQGNPEAAVPDLEAASAAEPTNGLLLDRLGQAYRALDRLQDAIRVLHKAAQLAPGESTIQLHLASALGEAGQNQEADVLMDRYRHMRPAQAPRGLMNYLSLTPEQQRADYRARVEKAVRDNPRDAGAQLHYLKLSLEDGRMDQVTTAARTLAGVKPSAAVLADAGRVLLEARQFGLARELLEKAAAADPSAGLDLDVSVAAFHTAGVTEGLRRIEAVPKSRWNPDYYLAHARMLDAAGNAADAIVSMERSMEMDSKRADLYWQAAVLLQREGRGSEAMKLLDRAEKILPQDYQIPLIKATLLELAGRTGDAEQLLDRIQRRWPDRAAVWVARGVFLSARSKAEDARRALETAVSLGARSPEARSYLADPKLFHTRPPQDW